MRSIDDDAPSLLNEEPEFVHDEEKDDISKLQSLLKELDMSGGVARIFRQRPGQADYPYLSEMPIDAFSLENLKRIFGGGKYLVRFAAKGGRYVRSIRFAIDNCFKGEMDIVPPTTAAPAQNNDSTNALLAFMMQQQQAQQQQQQNMMTLMMTMMTESQKSMAGVMVAAMGGKPSQEPASKFIDVMMPLLTENMKPRGGIAELAETVKLTKELMGPPQPEKEEKDDMLERLMTVGAPLIGAFMNRNQPQPTPQPRPVAPAAPAALPTPEQAAQAKAQDLLNKLRFVTPILARAAKKNAYIDSYLDILDDSLDDEGYEMLVYALKRDDWISTLFNDNPEVIANRQWFESLREAIVNPDEDTDAAGEAPEPGAQNQEQAGLVP
jgi:hypothetical protein